MQDLIARIARTSPSCNGCLEWAIGETQIVAAFRKDTGNNWSPATSPLDKMIDEACGVGEDFLRQFIEWFNVNVWGPIDGPADDDIVQRIDAA